VLIQLFFLLNLVKGIGNFFKEKALHL